MRRNRELLKLSIASVRACWPGLVAIQACAILLVATYYLSLSFQHICHKASLFKQQGGWLFAALSSIVANGICPELIKLGMRNQPKPTPLRLLHQFSMFAVLGILVDRFYMLQTVLFGEEVGPKTLAAKILLDQFGYSLMLVTPFIVVWYFWQENGYSPSVTLRTLNLQLLWGRVLPIFVGNFCFWVPALLALYSLPTELQFLLSLPLGAAWSLLLVFMANRQVESHACRGQTLD